jgi:Xaa-Pro dipeptidase
MPQDQTPVTDYRTRIEKMQDMLKASAFRAIVLEPGPAMLYLTGVRWGKSERTFAMVLPATGQPVWVLPAFEEERARELIRLGNDDIRVWQEDESPFSVIVDALKDRGVVSGRVGIDPAARFFVFDGILRLAPGLEFGVAPAPRQATANDGLPHAPAKSPGRP